LMRPKNETRVLLKPFRYSDMQKSFSAAETS